MIWNISRRLYNQTIGVIGFMTLRSLMWRFHGPQETPMLRSADRVLEAHLNESVRVCGATDDSDDLDVGFEV